MRSAGSLDPALTDGGCARVMLKNHMFLVNLAGITVVYALVGIARVVVAGRRAEQTSKADR